MTMEYLATEAPPRRRQSWAVGVVVVVLVALAAGFLWWTDMVRRNANDQLAEAFVAAQEPVSYTHLDVYKRQGPDHGAEGRCRGRAHRLGTR